MSGKSFSERERKIIQHHRNKKKKVIFFFLKFPSICVIFIQISFIRLLRKKKKKQFIDKCDEKKNVLHFVLLTFGRSFSISFSFLFFRPYSSSDMQK